MEDRGLSVQMGVTNQSPAQGFLWPLGPSGPVVTPEMLQVMLVPIAKSLAHYIGLFDNHHGPTTISSLD